MEKFVGLDAGSVSVKLAVLDSEGRILKTQYIRHKGRPLAVVYDLLRDLGPASSLGITGSAGRLIARALGIEPVNEVIAQSYSTSRLYPGIRTIIEMGGEDSKLILLENSGQLFGHLHRLGSDKNRSSFSVYTLNLSDDGVVFLPLGHVDLIVCIGTDTFTVHWDGDHFEFVNFFELRFRILWISAHDYFPLWESIIESILFAQDI